MDSLKRLAADPAYANEMPAIVRMKIAAEDGQWWKFWWLVPVNQWERMAWGPASLAILAGCCWFVFALQAGQLCASRGVRWWVCAAALVLGVLSIWPTHLMISWQEKTWGLVAQDNLVGGIRFFVLGVGLREELSKLLLFVPLVPLVVRRGSELEALIVPTCVGLGFAATENILYFKASFGSSSVSRYLTANFFHMAATGLAGLALVRGVWHPKTRAAEALAVFGVIVFAHGMYDALLSLSALEEYAMGSSIIYVLLAYQYFHELREMRIERQETVSLSATFLCGVSLVTAVTFVYLSGQFGSRLAAQLMAPDLIATALMVYMFLREIPAPLVTR